MKKYQRLLAVLCLVVLSALPACGNGKEKSQAAEGKDQKAIDVCALLTQQEVDTLFDGSPGPGRPDSPVPQVQGCVWPAEGMPKFILQVLAAPANVTKSIDPGKGYKVMSLDGLSGPAAVAIQLGNPQYGTTEGVAILGIVKGKRMVTLSPVHLDIKEGSPAFDLLKKLADSAAQRL